MLSPETEVAPVSTNFGIDSDPVRGDRLQGVRPVQRVRGQAGRASGRVPSRPEGGVALDSDQTRPGLLAFPCPRSPCPEGSRGRLTSAPGCQITLSLPPVRSLRNSPSSRARGASPSDPMRPPPWATQALKSSAQRELQRQAEGRVPERRELPHAAQDRRPRRAVETAVQYRSAPQYLRWASPGPRDDQTFALVPQDASAPGAAAGSQSNMGS